MLAQPDSRNETPHTVLYSGLAATTWPGAGPKAGVDVGPTNAWPLMVGGGDERGWEEAMLWLSVMSEPRARMARQSRARARNGLRDGRMRYTHSLVCCKRKWEEGKSGRWLAGLSVCAWHRHWRLTPTVSCGLWHLYTMTAVSFQSMQMPSLYSLRYNSIRTHRDTLSQCPRAACA